MSFSSQAPSIIVADDDKSVRIVIGQALKKQGYLVHTTATVLLVCGIRLMPSQMRF